MRTDAVPAILKNKAQEIDALCQKYQVTYLAVFGSAVTENFRVDSDLDFLVSFDGGLSARNKSTAFFGLKLDLETLFGRSVDLITHSSLTNPYFRESVIAGQRALYAA